jgi:hypothetical protein
MVHTGCPTEQLYIAKLERNALWERLLQEDKRSNVLSARHAFDREQHWARHGSSPPERAAAACQAKTSGATPRIGTLAAPAWSLGTPTL